jgi:hypothetical protein
VAISVYFVFLCVGSVAVVVPDRAHHGQETLEIKPAKKVGRPTWHVILAVQSGLISTGLGGPGHGFIR